MVCGATSITERPVRSGGTKVAVPLSDAASGIDTSKVEPAPSSLCSVMRPFMRLTMRSLMLRPRPVPP
jgi:hypothetical protein